MKRVILTYAMFLLSLSLSAQTDIVGKVCEADGGKGIEGVFISLYSDGKLSGYSYSDETGGFNISADVSTGVLKASMLGFESTEIVWNGQRSVEIRMKEKELNLKEAKVTSSVIRKANDTTDYYIHAFKGEDDLVLEDILKKLPGITVSESGGISHNGQSISKFYIEGLDLMGNRYGMVTRNISPDIIARVQIIENHQHIRALENISPSDRSAVNIILKENARNSWLFSGDAAVGLSPFLYDSRLMLTRFSRKSQSIFLLKGNNIGKDLSNDLMTQKYATTSRAFLYTPGNTDSDLSNTFGIRKSTLPIPDEYYFDNNSICLSANHLAVTGKESRLAFNLNALAQQWGEDEHTVQTIHLTDSDPLIIKEEESRDDRSLYLNGQVNLEKNTAKKYLYNTIALSGQIREHISTVSDHADDRYRLPSFKISNTFEEIIRVGDNAINIKSDTKFVYGNHSLTMNGADFDTSVRERVEGSRLESENSVSFNKTYGNLSYRFAGDLNVEWQMTSTDIDKADFKGIPNDLIDNTFAGLSVSPGINNRILWERNSWRAEAGLPVSLNYMRYSNDGIWNAALKPSVYPSAGIRYSFSQSSQIGLNGSYLLTSSSISSADSGILVTDYRSARSEGLLDTRSSWRGSVYFRYNDIFRMMSGNISAGIYGQSSDIMSSFDYREDISISSMMMRRNSSSQYYADASFKKHFGIRKLIIEISGGSSLAEESVLLQSEEKTYYTRSFNGNINISTEPADWFRAEAECVFDNSKVLDSETDPVNSFTTEGSVHIRPLPKFTISGSVFHLHQISESYRISNTPILKAGCNYKFEKFTIFGECINILNSKEFKRESISMYQTVSNSFHLRGRKWMIGIRMAL